MTSLRPKRKAGRPAALQCPQATAKSTIVTPQPPTAKPENTASEIKFGFIRYRSGIEKIVPLSFIKNLSPSTLSDFNSKCWYDVYSQDLETDTFKNDGKYLPARVLMLGGTEADITRKKLNKRFVVPKLHHNESSPPAAESVPSKTDEEVEKKDLRKQGVLSVEATIINDLDVSVAKSTKKKSGSPPDGKALTPSSVPVLTKVEINKKRRHVSISSEESEVTMVEKEVILEIKNDIVGLKKKYNVLENKLKKQDKELCSLRKKIRALGRETTTTTNTETTSIDNDSVFKVIPSTNSVLGSTEEFSTETKNSTSGKVPHSYKLPSETLGKVDPKVDSAQIQPQDTVVSKYLTPSSTINDEPYIKSPNNEPLTDENEISHTNITSDDGTNFIQQDVVVKNPNNSSSSNVNSIFVLNSDNNSKKLDINYKQLKKINKMKSQTKIVKGPKPKLRPSARVAQKLNLQHIPPLSFSFTEEKKLVLMRPDLTYSRFIKEVYDEVVEDDNYVNNRTCLGQEPNRKKGKSEKGEAASIPISPSKLKFFEDCLEEKMKSQNKTSEEIELVMLQLPSVLNDKMNAIRKTL